MSEAVKRYDCTNGGARFCNGCYQMSEDNQGEYVLAADHDRIVAGLTEAGRKMQAERDQLAERCRELEAQMDGIAGDGALAEERCDTLSAENESLRKENERLATLIEDNAEAGTLRAEVERLRNDAERITWLAAQARMIYGHKCEASYQLSELPDLIQSGREECSPDDLRRAIDAALEASR